MGHIYGNMQETVEVIRVARQGRHMNITFFCIQNKTFRRTKYSFILTILYWRQYITIIFHNNKKYYSILPGDSTVFPQKARIPNH
jgi:hypothetical protein